MVSPRKQISAKEIACIPLTVQHVPIELVDQELLLKMGNIKKKVQLAKMAFKVNFNPVFKYQKRTPPTLTTRAQPIYWLTETGLSQSAVSACMLLTLKETLQKKMLGVI